MNASIYFNATSESDTSFSYQNLIHKSPCERGLKVDRRVWCACWIVFEVCTNCPLKGSIIVSMGSHCLEVLSYPVPRGVGVPPFPWVLKCQDLVFPAGGLARFWHLVKYHILKLEEKPQKGKKSSGQTRLERLYSGGTGLIRGCCAIEEGDNTSWGIWASHSCDYENYCLLCFDAMWSDRYVYTMGFWLLVSWSQRFAATPMYDCIAYTMTDLLMCWCVTSSWVISKSVHPLVTKLMQLVTALLSGAVRIVEF